MRVCFHCQCLFHNYSNWDTGNIKQIEKAKSTRSMYIYGNFVPQLEGKKIKISWEKDINGAKHSIVLRPVSQLRFIPPRILIWRLIKPRLVLQSLISSYKDLMHIWLQYLPLYCTTLLILEEWPHKWMW